MTHQRTAQLTPKAIDDLFVTWRLIGPEIARLGVWNASQSQLAGMRRLIATYDDAAAERSALARAARFVEIADALYDLLAVAGTNERLVEAYRGLDGELSRVWSHLVAAPDGSGLLRGVQSRWGQALDLRDGDMAAEFTGAFIASSHARARRLIRQDAVR